MPSDPLHVPLVLPDLTLDLVTDRGVFSGSRVDPGTRLLLLEGPPPPPSGDLLDLGCGYGPIAVSLARRSPDARVWAVDVNERALACCRTNAAAAGVGERVRAVTPDEVPPAVSFAGIWSNPPIRVGKAVLHGMLDTWLARLAPGAVAALVVHKHLGADSLAARLRAQGLVVDRLVSRAGYRVLQVRR